MPTAPATQQDIENLRNDLRDHVTNDRADFDYLRREVGAMKEGQAGWNGGLRSILWLLGIGLPAIFAAIIALAVKHP
jgi:FtsZ-binding cell division protein ZapB